MFKNNLLFFILILLSQNFLFSQNLPNNPSPSDNATLVATVGFRLSPFYGVTAKGYFADELSAVEGIFSTREDGFGVTALYQVHTDNLWIDNLRAYGGIGGHLNVFNNPNSITWNWGNNSGALRFGEEKYYNAGLDMMLGVEYTFPDFPFNLSVDWKPALNLVGDHGLSTNQFAASIRFAFWRK